MKNLKKYIEEKLIINKYCNPYQHYPKTWDELRQIIIDRYEEQGPGTKQEPIDFNDIDVSEITTFFNKVGIFQETQFKYIDISDWDVSNVEYMQYMFCNCYKLKSVGDISKWDISGVEDIHGMFSGCEKLESIGDLSKWVVSNVKYTQWMFCNCKKLKSVGDLSNWNNIENTYKMFFNSGITNIPNWYKE